MRADPNFLKQMVPAHPDGAANEAKRFVDGHREWVRSISVRSWEALRRLAPEAKEYNQLSGAFEKHLTESAKRDKSGTGWSREAARTDLIKAFRSARLVEDRSIPGRLF